MAGSRPPPSGIGGLQAPNGDEVADDEPMQEVDSEGNESNSEEGTDAGDGQADYGNYGSDADGEVDDDGRPDGDEDEDDEDQDDEEEDSDEGGADAQTASKGPTQQEAFVISSDDGRDDLVTSAFGSSGTALAPSAFDLNPPPPAPGTALLPISESPAVPSGDLFGAGSTDFLSESLPPGLGQLADAAAAPGAQAFDAQLAQAAATQAENELAQVRAEHARLMAAKEQQLANELAQARALAQQEVAALRGELSAVRQALAAEQAESERARVQLADVTNQLNISQERTAELERDKAEVAAAAAAAELGRLPDGTDAAVGAPQAVINSLRIQLKSTASSNRELLRAYEREKTAARQAEDRAYQLNIKVRETQTEVTHLLSEIQGLKNADSSRNFKLTSVSQELEFSKKELESVKEQLSKVQANWSLFRTSKTAEVSRLQTSLSEAEARSEALENKVNSLQKAYERGLAKQSELLDRAERAERRHADDEAAFKSEMDTQLHLVRLYEQRAADAERRANGVEEQWDQITRGWKEREDQARRQIADEVQKREQVEQERETLKKALNELADGVGIPIIRADGTEDANGSAAEQALLRASSAEPGTSSLTTAGGSIFGSLFSGRARSSTPAGPLLSAVTASPSAQLAAKVQKSGKSFTQVYTELTIATEELRREREEHRKVADMLREVTEEAKLNETRWKAEREDATRTAQQLEVLNREFALVCSDSQKREREATSARAELERVKLENRLLLSQVADQGNQIRALVQEAALREDPSAQDRLTDDGRDLPDLTRTDAKAVPQQPEDIITANLVTFKTLTEMVTQNQRLLRMTRELSIRMEAREKELVASGAAAATSALDEAELSELKATLDRLEEQLRAERSNKRALTAERDLLKARLARASDHSSGDLNGLRSNGSVSSSSPADAALLQAHELLRLEHMRLQKHYETYRAETAEDMKSLKAYGDDARREAARAETVAAKERASRQAADERHEMVVQNLELKRQEVEELGRQTTRLQKNLTKAELTIQTLDNQLADTRAALEQARTAAANAQAERDLSKNMEKRLMDEHRSLISERSNLTQLLQSVQTMQLDLERVGSQNRERLEAQVSTLEGVVRDLKDRLAKEEADHREAALRREVDAKAAQAKLEAAQAEMLESKKALVEANGQLAQLNSKHDELSKELQLKVEKLAVYERAASDEETANGGVSKEKRLELELAEIRGNLKSLAVELEASRAHVEQFKSIAQAAEDATEQLQATLEETKKDAADQVAAKENEMNALKQRMSTFIEELEKSQQEAAELNKQLISQKAEFNRQKRELEDALTQLTGAEEAAAAREGPIKNDRDQQARLAEEAERKYQSELVSHARDVEELHRVREQLRTAQAESRDAIKAKETAEAKLSGSESSWVTQREAIERDMEGLKASIEDLKSQNALLLDALETANEQANKLRQAHADAGTESVDPDTSVSAMPSAQLSEVVRFLRKEKEIVDVQLELSRQEAARLRQSLDYTNSAVEKLRTELAEERGKLVAASAGSASQQDLLEKVQQVNLLRESNATLRQDTERAKARIAALETQLRTAQTELQPLREQASMAEAELESSREQAKLLEEDSKRWQNRVHNILAQYNQQDPEEISKLKEQAAKVEELVETNKKLQAENQQIQSRHEDLSTKFKSLRAQTMERLNQSSTKISELEQKLADKDQQHQTELTALQGKFEAAVANANSESATQAVAEAQSKWDEEKKKLDERNETHLTRAKDFLREAKSAKTAQKEAEDKLEGLQKELDALRAGNSAEIEKAVAEKLAEFKKSAELGGQLDEADSNLLSLQERLAKQEEDLKQAHARIAELEAALAAAGPTSEGATAASGDVAAEVEALKAQHAQELAKVRTEATAQAIEKQRELEAQIAKLKEGRSALKEGDDGGTAEPDPEKIEEEVQKRLSALEKEREAAQSAAIKTALEAQLKDVAERHKSEVQDAVERAKNEANLRNQLHLSKRDKTITTLQKELAELKGGAASAADGGKATSTPATGAETAEPTTSTPAAAAGAGTGATTSSSPTATTVASKALQGQSIAGRGGRALRGVGVAGRGGSVAAAAAAAAAASSNEGSTAATGAKRKLGATGGGAAGEGTPTSSGAAAGAGAGAGAATTPPAGPAAKRLRSGGRGGRRGGGAGG